jgi:hypothetical protein
MQRKASIASSLWASPCAAAICAAALLGRKSVRLLIVTATLALILLGNGCDPTPTPVSCPPGSDGCTTDADCGSPLLYCNESCNCVPPPLYVCSALSDGCTTDDDCPEGQACNPITCNCCPEDSDGCSTDADCGVNQYCDTFNCTCRCNEQGDPGCNGDLPGGGFCWTYVRDEFGHVSEIPVRGFCGQECQCCECESDADCGRASYCNPQSCQCEPRPMCTTCSEECIIPEYCREVSEGGCDCVGLIDVYGCFMAEQECVTWLPVPERLWPGDGCQAPNGNSGVCDQTCDCVVDCTWGVCMGLEDGDPCYPVGGAMSSSTHAGVCHDCACVCPEGTSCAGRIDGHGCVVSASPYIYGHCQDCQCCECETDADCVSPLLYCNENCRCVPPPVTICSVLSDGCLSDEDCADGEYCDAMCNCQPGAPSPPPPPPPGESEPSCGDGVCQAGENSDLCSQDCECIDNGVIDPSEGCGCADVLCEGEDPATGCGVPCPTGACGGGLTCTDGMCWDGCICGGSCGEGGEEEPRDRGRTGPP